MTFVNDIKVAFRSLVRSKGLALTVVLTLALGIGANTAIFSLVRGVLLRPLVNRDEDRLIYIRQSAPGLQIEDAHFSVPEMDDLRKGVKSFSSFGNFSVIGFTMIGLGDPREVRAGVVDGSYFDVMGLHPVMGRLLGPADDGPSAPGAMVLTYHFWTTVLHSDPTVLGKTVRLGSRTATVVGVLEHCVPYPAETEIIANVVTSPHHLSATMVQGRVHRMTELFGRLAPGATLEQARAELATVYAGMVREHPESYSTKAQGRIEAVRLRDQVTSKASTVLWLLLAASGLVFLIACSNVANLILARTVRRQGELAMRQALGAGTGDLRRLLLAESLLLCGAGALLGVLAAQPMVAILARYASRFSPRALDLTVDSSMLWVGALLAVAASVLLAYVPRLPQVGTKGLGRGMATARVAGGAGGRQKVFAVTQIAASFILLAGAAMLLRTLLSLTATHAGFETRQVLAMNVPAVSYGRTPQQITAFYKETIRRVGELSNVEHVALGTQIPWRDAGGFGPGFQFTVEGRTPTPGEEDPRAQFRTVSPGFFASLGVPVIAGRDFNDLDRAGSEPVVIVTQSLAQRMFPNLDAVNRHLMWTDPVTKFIDVSNGPRRIVGVVADIDDEHLVPGPSLVVFHPMGQQELWNGRLFVRAHGDPYALVSPVRKIIHDLSADQPVERAATLEDVRAEVLTPDRLNTVVFGVFAAVALAIALVGVAGVLAFSVSGRTREFGIRLAMGSDPSHLVRGVLAQGAVIGLAGVAAGALGGYGLAKLAASYFRIVEMPGAAPLAGSAAVLIAAAVLASLLPALRASRVDVIQALKSE